MSHQDARGGNASETNAQQILAATDAVLKGVDLSSIQFRADCLWSVRGLVMACLLWAWSREATLTERYCQALRVLRCVARRLVPAKVSYQAFMKLVVRWTLPLQLCLREALQQQMRKEFPQRFQTGAYIVLAADGSKLQVPRTASNQSRYTSSKSRKKNGKKARSKRARSRSARARQARRKKADSPQMSLTLLHHVQLRLPWSWRLGGGDSSEREHLREMIPELPANTLLVADCGFVGYDFWSELLASGREFVIRVGGNVRLLKQLGVVRESYNTVYVWPDKAAQRSQPPLVLRLVVVHDGRQPWYLVTSVRDVQKLSDQEVGEIYGSRWRIELFFRHFKQTFGRAKLRSHKAEHAECEARWSLLGLWTLLLYSQLQRRGLKAGPGHLSVARVLRAFGKTLHEYKSRPEAGDSLDELLSTAVVDGYVRSSKASRGYPRKKYESTIKPPRLQPATKAQRQLAMQVMSQQISKGLTA